MNYGGARFKGKSIEKKNIVPPQCYQNKINAETTAC